MGTIQRLKQGEQRGVPLRSSAPKEREKKKKRKQLNTIVFTQFRVNINDSAQDIQSCGIAGHSQHTLIVYS